MKSIIFVLTFLFINTLNASEEPKMVIDLTTSSVVKFEKNILKGIEVHKTYYANSLKELEVAVVIHGEAYKFFVKNIESTLYKDDKDLVKVYADLKKRIATMSDTYDVEFFMCKAGMNKRKLEDKDIVDFVKIIPNSTIGLIDKQNEGFAYIPVGD